MQPLNSTLPWGINIHADVSAHVSMQACMRVHLYASMHTRNPVGPFCRLAILSLAAISKDWESEVPDGSGG